MLKESIVVSILKAHTKQMLVCSVIMLFFAFGYWHNFTSNWKKVVFLKLISVPTLNTDCSAEPVDKSRTIFTTSKAVAYLSIKMPKTVYAKWLENSDEPLPFDIRCSRAGRTYLPKSKEILFIHFTII